MQLTPHFSLEELIFSQTAARHGIDNTPNGEIIERLTLLAQALEQMREKLGHPIHINSGYRSVDLNDIVPGSSDTSAHTLGWAADFTCGGFGSPYDVCVAVRDSGLVFDQIIHEYGSWTHLSIDPRARKQTLSKFKGRNYQQGFLRA